MSTAEREITLRYSDARRTVAELEDLIIVQNDSGGFVSLGDLATVNLTQSVPELKSFIDGQRAAIIRISKNKQDDAIDAFTQVQELVAEEEARFPDLFGIAIINNTTEVISDRINLVLKNTAQGLVLVLAVTWLFLGFREAVWISLALPVSFLGGLFVMQVFGVTINMISLVALLMAVGLIMDDSNNKHSRARSPDTG